jgi:para-nitrobenzyl esterase
MTSLRVGREFLLAAVGLAACHAGAPASPGATPDLGGTAWQLVRFQGGDGTTLTPDDPSKYTLRFGADGRLSAWIDCNRGAGGWKSPGPGQLEIGPLAVTRAQCTPGSLHDRLVRDLAFMRSYLVRGGRLFVSLQADAGIYEFAPLANAAMTTTLTKEGPFPCA